MTEVVTLFVSLLTLVLQLSLLALVVFRLVTLPAARRHQWSQFMGAFEPYRLPLAFAISAVVVAGSLYMSEIAKFTPCHLCWIQRSLLYPQLILTGILLIRRTLWPVRALAALLALVDIPVSAYHYLIEWFPTIEATSCDPDNPCTFIWYRELGYVTLAMSALTAAVCLFTLLFLTWPRQSKGSSSPAQDSVSS